MTKSPFFVGVMGAAAWAAAIFVVRPIWAAALLLLAAFVVVPMLLRLIETPDRYGRHAPTWIASIYAALPAAACLAASFYFQPSRLAGALAVPWFAVTALSAMFGVRRMLERGVGPAEEACIDVALMFLAVGGAWGFLCRGFDRPLGFDHLVAVLTAVHFHFAGFALAALVGLAGRRLPLGAPKLVALLVVLGVIALAFGIALGRPMVEQMSGWTLAFGGCLMAALHLHLATRKARLSFRVLAAASGLCLATALIIAALYAARASIVVPWVADLGHMQRYHGTLNALGFAMLATFAHAADPGAPRIGAPGIPFSALSARFRVGPDYFERTRVALFLRRAPQGLVESLDEHRREDLETELVHPAIRAFYERTIEHEMLVTPTWSPLFVIPGRLAAFFGRVIGQMAMPTAPEDKPIAGRLVALDAEADGRSQARGWVRTYADGRAMYVAAYGRHRYRGVMYMSIAMPVPFGNVSSVLRMDPIVLDDIGELAIDLTTRSKPGAPSDAGIWFVSRLFGAVRLPLHETIEVRPLDEENERLPGAQLGARHTMWIFGVRYLTLEYLIKRTPVLDEPTLGEMAGTLADRPPPPRPRAQSEEEIELPAAAPAPSSRPPPLPARASARSTDLRAAVPIEQPSALEADRPLEPPPETAQPSLEAAPAPAPAPAPALAPAPAPPPAPAPAPEPDASPPPDEPIHPMPVLSVGPPPPDSPEPAASPEAANDSPAPDSPPPDEVTPPKGDS